jgi:hypothetical protein
VLSHPAHCRESVVQYCMSERTHPVQHVSIYVPCHHWLSSELCSGVRYPAIVSVCCRPPSFKSAYTFSLRFGNKAKCFLEISFVRQGKYVQLDIMIYLFPRGGPDGSVRSRHAMSVVPAQPRPALASVCMSECGRRFTPHEKPKPLCRPYVTHPPYCCLCDDGHSFRHDGRQ